VKTIVIASANPVKMEATRLGFEKMFPLESFELHSVTTPSGVRDQPMTSQETEQGAYNRACAAAKVMPQADYWVGIEGGIEELGEEMAAFAWVVVYSPHLTGKGRTGTFFLPPTVASLIRQGKELGEADDIIFNQNNSKQVNGAIGILTGDVIDRTRLYEHAVILALTPFKNPDLYGG
jgi:inosine/xanthosine triphosphatase